MAKFGELWGKTDTRVTLRRGSGVALTSSRNGADLEFVAKFGELWGNPRKMQTSHCVTAQVLH